jgi:hypothetical protein
MSNTYRSIRKYCILYWLLFIVFYFKTEKLPTFLLSKVDDIYMVLTIFYSAVIGMVISNNLQLKDSHFRQKLRLYYNDKRKFLTILFLISTLLYFFYDMEFVKSVLLTIGVDITKIMVGWLLFASAYYLFSMRMISYDIADIEESDLDEAEKGIVVESITDIISDGKWHYAKSLLRDVDLPDTNENVQKYIEPLIDMFNLEKEGEVGNRLRIRKPQRNK